ncbi:MAG: DUF4129 domain-containing protein [Anaerolineae bacterium]
MVKNRKFWVLIAAAVAIVALFLLSSSLSTVEFRPGKPFPWGLFMTGSKEIPPTPSFGEMMSLVTILRVIILILLPLTVIYMIFTKEGRRRALRILIQLLLFMLLMSIILERQASMPATPEQGITNLSPLEEVEFEPPPEFIPGDMRDLTTMLSVGLAVVLTIVIVTTLYVFWRRRRLEQDDTLLELARGAQEALDDIQAGGSLRNAVIRCYAEMSRVISEKRNIERGSTVTSHEFEEHLVKAGLPKTPVYELTHLFEEARYGNRDPGPAEEQRAVACLSSIVTAVAELSR